MSLKHQLVISPNEKYDKQQIDELEKVQVALEKAVMKRHKTEAGLMLTMKNPTDILYRVNDSTMKNLKSVRNELKKLYEEPEKKREIHITSDKVWKMFPETIGDECGRTRYGAAEEFKVDVRIPFVKETGTTIKDAVKVAQEKAIKKLRDYRAKRKYVDFIERTYNIANLPVQPRYKVYAGGGYGEGKERHHIHFEKGTFVKLKEATKLRKVFEVKTPQTKDHHVGVEIEFVSKMDQFALAQAFVDEKVEEFVNLTTDGSLRGEGEFKQCHEVRLLAPENLVVQALERALRAINKDKASKVTKLCGLHVHLDVRKRDKQKVYNNLLKAQKILYAMNPVSRLTGEDSKGQKGTVYSKQVTKSTLEEAMTEASNAGDRYYGINVLSIGKHNTIEIRIHSGSTDYMKISNWIKILMGIVNHKEIKKDISDPETFCDTLSFDMEMLGYIKERIAKFNKNGKHITLDEAS